MTSHLVCAPTPNGAHESLAALPSFEILDTDPSLDRIVGLASRLFRAPKAFISLVDREHQWLKAFCAHAMLETKPLVVCDATRDARFADNPLVMGEMSVRFYVGAPLRTRAGLTLGSLCVIDTVPRSYPAQELLDHLEDLAFLVSEHIELRSAMAVKRDITEQELRRSLLEKETLLQEVHHRVKNNLQIVSSLLKLQGDSLTDKNAAAALKESQQRVLSMAMIHERLYAGKQMAEVEFDSYARTLVQELVYSYAGKKGNVTGRLLPPPILLNIGQAIPCALILNELVTNALKYAYPDGRDGEVMVEINEMPGGRIRVAVSDRGQGLPPDFDWRNSNSLGLRIVDVLTQQLGGTLTVESGQRTTFILEFPRQEVKPAVRPN
jgi:two-component sensor histidine kinase